MTVGEVKALVVVLEALSAIAGIAAIALAARRVARSRHREEQSEVRDIPDYELVLEAAKGGEGDPAAVKLAQWMEQYRLRNGRDFDDDVPPRTLQDLLREELTLPAWLAVGSIVGSMVAGVIGTLAI